MGNEAAARNNAATQEIGENDNRRVPHPRAEGVAVQLNEGADLGLATGQRETTPPNLKVALELARAGIPLFPAQATPKGNGWTKVPLIKNWRERATMEEAQIAEWWSVYPDAIPGIDLSRADLFVLDADRHGGPDGIAALESLERENGPLTALIRTETAGGGLHLFFRQSSGMRLGNSRGSLPLGIDVRGDGGWIVAPGSIRPDGKVWQPIGTSLIDACRTGVIPELPDWLRSIVEDNVIRIDRKAKREIGPKQDAAAWTDPSPSCGNVRNQPSDVR